MLNHLPVALTLACSLGYSLTGFQKLKSQWSMSLSIEFGTDDDLAICRGSFSISWGWVLVPEEEEAKESSSSNDSI